MEKFLIEGGNPLIGSIRVNGSKNAALPMMAAALLTREPVTLTNVPRLSDIDVMSEILRALGVAIERRGTTLVMQVQNEDLCRAPYESVRKMRASFGVLGPLVAKRGRAEVSYPGGCNLGERPVDIHLQGLERLGMKHCLDGGYVRARADRLEGSWIFLGGRYGSTVGGTLNVLMAATLARGRTVIEYAACEPEVREVCGMLIRMGARIQGVGSPRLEVEGVSSLRGGEFQVIPDRIEAGTLLIAGAITGGDVTVEGARREDLMAVIDVLRKTGVTVHDQEETIRIRGRRRINPILMATNPFPGFPTDLQAPIMSLLALADGPSVVQERVYPDRFMHVAELARMGAIIHREGPTAIIQGVDRLRAAPVMASDLRGGAALILAGLAAEGRTEVLRAYHVDRGYERLDERLNSLGASISRVQELPMAAAA